MQRRDRKRIMFEERLNIPPVGRSTIFITCQFSIYRLLSQMAQAFFIPVCGSRADCFRIAAPLHTHRADAARKGPPSLRPTPLLYLGEIIHRGLLLDRGRRRSRTGFCA